MPYIDDATRKAKQQAIFRALVKGMKKKEQEGFVEQVAKKLPQEQQHKWVEPAQEVIKTEKPDEKEKIRQQLKEEEAERRRRDRLKKTKIGQRTLYTEDEVKKVTK